jgi:hypothetical protein
MISKYLLIRAVHAELASIWNFVPELWGAYGEIPLNCTLTIPRREPALASVPFWGRVWIYSVLEFLGNGTNTKDRNLAHGTQHITILNKAVLLFVPMWNMEGDKVIQTTSNPLMAWIAWFPSSDMSSSNPVSVTSSGNSRLFSVSPTIKLDDGNHRTAHSIKLDKHYAKAWCAEGEPSYSILHGPEWGRACDVASFKPDNLPVLSAVLVLRKKIQPALERG